MSNGPKLIITSEREKAGYDAVTKSEGKKKGMHILQSASSYESLASLSNDDGDDNKNGKKAIVLNKQNNFAPASCFFVHFFYEECGQKTTIFFSFF